MIYKTLLLTCEHGGNAVPARYRHAFLKAKTALRSHRGWDPGALKVACEMSRVLKVPLVFSEVSRLLVDLNRTRENPTLFSEFSRSLDANKLLKVYYEPHWKKVRQQLKSKKLHLAIHSFTPVFKGYRRRTDIGLLYDPKSKLEREFCLRLKHALKIEFPEYKIHLNRPYYGSGDGLTCEMRKELKRYIGVEIEINQRLKNTRDLGQKIARALLNSECA